MRISRIELMDAIKFLLPAIGINQSRKNLTHLYVEKKNDDLILTAANAFIVKRQIMTDISAEKNHSFLIPGYLLKNYLYLLENQPHLSQDSYTTVDIEPDKLTAGEVVKYKQPDIEYPNLDSLFSGETPEHMDIEDIKNPNDIGIDPRLLIACMNGLREDDTVKLKIKSPSEPIVIESFMDRRSAVILPVKIQW